MRFPDFSKGSFVSVIVSTYLSRYHLVSAGSRRLVLQDRDDPDTAHPLILCKCHTDDGVTADLFRRNVYASRLVPVF